jgi:UDP-glucose 4-epimerase
LYADPKATPDWLRIPAMMGLRRAGNPAVFISDAAKARAKLGWQPRNTDLAKGRSVRMGLASKAHACTH